MTKFVCQRTLILILQLVNTRNRVVNYEGLIRGRSLFMGMCMGYTKSPGGLLDDILYIYAQICCSNLYP